MKNSLLKTFIRNGAACLALALVACNTPATRTTSQPATPASESPEANLAETEARARARGISNVRYELSVQLSETSERFQGSAKIRFDWAPGDATETFLDLDNRAKIRALTINGVQTEPRFANHRVTLPNLRPGANSVEMEFDQVYATDGRGLHRFKDPEDQNVYLFTQFEAYDAHHLFPCFDQPDLKARLDLKVRAPAAWQVISTMRETSADKANDARVWIFPTTPVMSTYLFSLHAGPYHKWEASAGRVPLRLYARKAMVKYIHPQDWFKPTQQGLKFFGEFFGVPYPFKKYDQVIAPEFNSGAMENIAAVTFSERYLSRGIVTRDEREDIAEVILHEMAHQWFGDLVTMRWWNGLWLNESFATYMAQVAKARATEFKEGWEDFSLFQKARAYLEDQLSTTHPVEGPVPDTDSAFANFDSITYGKGASVIKQLSFFIGEKSFRKGLKSYFEQHAYRNTTIEDFLGAMERASGLKLAEWARTWLRSEGVDTLQAEFDCDKDRITRFELKVKGPGAGTSERPHRTRIALYKKEMGRLLPFKVVTASYQGSSTLIKELNGASCPALAFPNDDDHDYVKIQFDSKSLATIKTGLGALNSPLTRAMIWPGLYEAVRDLRLTAPDYLAIAASGVSAERSAKSLEAIVRRVSSVAYYLPQSSDAEQAARMSWIARFENSLWEKMNEPKNSTDLKLAATDGYLLLAESANAKLNLASLLDGDRLDQDRRWTALVRLSALGAEAADSLIATERKRDSSERGIKLALAAEAAAPRLERKQAWMKRALEKEDLSYSQKREVFQRFLPPMQVSLRMAANPDFYSRLPEIAKTKTLNFANLYVRSVLPVDCSPAPAEALGGFLKIGAPTLPAPLIKELRNGHQEDEICQRARAQSRKSSTL